jgi:putative transposase
MRAALHMPSFMPPIDTTTTHPLAVRPAGQVITLRQRDPWAEASDAQRAVAIARLDVVSYLRGLEAEGRSANKAVEVLQARHALGHLYPHLVAALKTCAKAGRDMPTRATMLEWRRIVREGGGRVELLENHKGRVVNAAPAWWGPAIERFNQPSKPDISAVHRYLVEVEGFACTYDQVRGYLNSVPAMLGRHSPARIGRNLYKLTQKAYIKRSTQNALPGDVYVADGYRADVYLAHPVTGGIWRPELTVAIDMRSRYPVGWRADEHEGTYAVQNMWAEAFARWGHVPPFLYVDNGSGHKNRLMSDSMVGFYARAGIMQTIHAIPGNPHGKGWVERFFRSVRDDFLKNWMPHLYCGDDMAPEALNRTVAEVKAGRLQLPSLAQFAAAFDAWIERYVQRPHPEDASRSIASIWSELVPLPPAGDVTELKRQATVLTVHRGMVKHGKRQYRHPDLLAFNGAKVLLEYDLMDDRVAVIRTPEGRWICDAQLQQAMDAIAPNRLEEKRQLRAADAIKRLEQKMDEAKARAGLVIDVDATAQAVIDVTATPVLPGPAGDDDITLDLTDLTTPTDNDLEDL